MTNNQLVSVVIPVYNSAKYIADAIDSVLVQTYKNCEIIIVDDGSTDNTGEVVNKYIRPQAVKYIYQENKGPSAARNRGIKEARGEYIAFLDSDDIWLPKKIEMQVRYFIENPSCGLIYTGCYTCSENGRTVDVFTSKQMSKQEILQTLYLRNVILTPTIVMVNKACFEKVGLFDEGLAVAEDWDMWLRIMQIYDFHRMNYPLAKVRIRPGSQSYYGDKNLDNEMKFLDKLFSKPSLKHNFIVKRKAYSYRYFAASWAFYKSGDSRKAKRYIIKSMYLYPFKLLPDKFWRYGLLLEILLGKKMSSGLKQFILKLAYQGNKE